MKQPTEHEGPSSTAVPPLSTDELQICAAHGLTRGQRYWHAYIEGMGFRVARSSTPLADVLRVLPTKAATVRERLRIERIDRPDVQPRRRRGLP